MNITDANNALRHAFRPRSEAEITESIERQREEWRRRDAADRARSDLRSMDAIESEARVIDELFKAKVRSEEREHDAQAEQMRILDLLADLGVAYS